MKASQIEASLGAWTEVSSNLIGMEVTLGNKGKKIGNISARKIVNGMLRATIAVDEEAQDLVGSLIMHDPCLLRPKIETDLPEIEVNLQLIPAEVAMVAPEDRGEEMSNAWNPGDRLLLAQVKEWQKKIEENTGDRGLLWAHMSESVYAGLMGLTVQEAHDELVGRSDARPLEQDGWWALEVHTVADC